MIVGVPSDGELDRARNIYAREASQGLKNLELFNAISKGPVISFGPEDEAGVILPHADALVIRAMIDN